MNLGAVLVVDDEAAIARVVRSTLEDAGYKARHVRDADSAFAAMREKPFDLVILDIEMPGISGLSLLELMKREPGLAQIPVIMLTVRSEEAYKVRGLRSGADDYLTKPFSAKELLARVEAVLRRTRGSTAQGIQLLRAGGLTLDLGRRQAQARGRKVDLTAAELDLLAALLRRKGQVLGYQVLGEAISGGTRDVGSDTVYAHIKNLRAKLGPEGRLIETVYGVGYRLNDDEA